MGRADSGEDWRMVHREDIPPQLEMVLALPAAIIVHPETLGRTFSSRMGGRPVSLTLPRFRWHGGRARYFVVPPRLRAVREDINWESYLDDP
jgi:hypothetical protein